MSFQIHLDAVRRAVPEVSVEEAREQAARGDVVVVDVRQAEEVALGRIESALAIPRGLLELELPRRVEDRDTALIVYCAGGTRSAMAAQSLLRLGYTRVASMAGGFSRWKTQGAPFVVVPLEPIDASELGAVGPEVPMVAPAQIAESAAVVDVREEDEIAAGYIRDAHLIPRGFLEMRIDAAVRDRTMPVVLVSSRGVRAAWAAQDLLRMGFSEVRVLDGGMAAWASGGHPIHRPQRLSPHDRLRYSRHLAIDEVGEEGQLTLLASRVLLMGAGGLGSPAAYYLAAAGVGKLGIIDSDVVDRSNLQRQIVHADDRVGMPKVESARMTLLGLNPDIAVTTYDARLTSANVEEVFADYDLVVDGGDNFPTRYLVNDACVRLGLPCVHGSVYRFEGQVTVFSPASGGPCYRCLYPEPPPPELAPSCAEAGVLGVLPGIIGCLQANEAIKLLLGIGEPLVGRLVHFDGLRMKFRELKYTADPACRVCAPGAEWTGYIDYEHFCDVSL